MPSSHGTEVASVCRQNGHVYRPARAVDGMPSPPVASVGAMTFEVRPATLARFDDVATMLGPKNPASTVCWCLSHRIDAKTSKALVGPARGEFVRALTRRPVAPGVLAYDGDEVVGWAAVAPAPSCPSPARRGFRTSTTSPRGRSGASGSARDTA